MGSKVKTPKKEGTAREERVDRITDSLMETFCGPNSSFAQMEERYQSDMIGAKSNPQELRKLQDAFLNRVEEEFPFAMSKKGVPSPDALKKRYDNDDYTIVSREDIRKNISKAVSNSLDALNETAIRMIKWVQDNGQSPTPADVLIGLGEEGRGANEFNRHLIKTLEAELGPALALRGISMSMRISNENEFSVRMTIDSRMVLARREPTEFQKEKEA